MNNVLLYFAVGCVFSFIFKVLQDFVYNKITKGPKLEELSGFDLIILTISWPYWFFKFLCSYLKSIFETK